MTPESAGPQVSGTWPRSGSGPRTCSKLRIHPRRGAYQGQISICRVLVSGLLALLIWSAFGHTLLVEPDPGSIAVVLVVLAVWFGAYMRLWVLLRGPKRQERSTRTGVMARFVVLLLVAFVAAMIGVQLLQPRQVVGQPHIICDWQDEYDRTLDELGENPADWIVGDAGKHWGYTDVSTLTAVVDSEVWCAYVGDVIRHEWMHLQTERSGLVLGDRYEVVADCGTTLMGGTFAPYIDPKNPGYLGDCADQDNADAHWLIGWEPVACGSHPPGVDPERVQTPRLCVSG